MVIVNHRPSKGSRCLLFANVSPEYFKRIFYPTGRTSGKFNQTEHPSPVTEHFVLLSSYCKDHASFPRTMKVPVSFFLKNENWHSQMFYVTGGGWLEGRGIGHRKARTGERHVADHLSWPNLNTSPFLLPLLQPNLCQHPCQRPPRHTDQALKWRVRLLFFSSHLREFSHSVYTFVEQLIPGTEYIQRSEQSCLLANCQGPQIPPWLSLSLSFLALVQVLQQ